MVGDVDAPEIIDLELEVRYSPACNAAWMRWSPPPNLMGAREVMTSYQCDPTQEACRQAGPYTPYYVTSDGQGTKTWSAMADMHNWLLTGSGIFGGPHTQVD
jgi:hypothetical protein